MQRLVWLLFIVFLSLIGVIGDSFIKSAAAGGKGISGARFIAGFLIYAFTAFGWFYAMRHIKLGTLGVFYAVSTVALLYFAGRYLFHESYNSLEVFGIFLAIVSLIILGRFA